MAPFALGREGEQAMIRTAGRLIVARMTEEAVQRQSQILILLCPPVAQIAVRERVASEEWKAGLLMLQEEPGGEPPAVFRVAAGAVGTQFAAMHDVLVAVGAACAHPIEERIPMALAALGFSVSPAKDIAGRGVVEIGFGAQDEPALRTMASAAVEIEILPVNRRVYRRRT